jgi:hypothetical protein
MVLVASLGLHSMELAVWRFGDEENEIYVSFACINFSK